MNLTSITKIIFEYDLDEEPKLNDKGEFTIKLPLVAELREISKINPDIRVILISKRTCKMFELDYSTQGFRIHPKSFDSSIFGYY